jgi:hypothetical protein
MEKKLQQLNCQIRLNFRNWLIWYLNFFQLKIKKKMSDLEDIQL